MVLCQTFMFLYVHEIGLYTYIRYAYWKYNAEVGKIWLKFKFLNATGEKNLEIRIQAKIKVFTVHRKQNF